MKEKHTKASGLKHMKLKYGRKVPAPGDKVFELGNGDVVWISERRLFLCKCIEWGWECTTIDNVTYCWKVCKRMKCEEPTIYVGPLK